MKLYLLTNMYVGGQHPGIQGVHSAVRLVAKYASDDRDFPELTQQVFDYVDNHETVVMLQSGMDHTGLSTVVKDLDEAEKAASFFRTRLGEHTAQYPLVPFAEFKEPGLNNSITSVAVLCSTKMVDDMSELRKEELTPRYMVSTYGEVLGELLIKMTYMRLV